MSSATFRRTQRQQPTTGLALKRKVGFYYDQYLLLAVGLLLALGLLIMSSASMAIAEKSFAQPFYYILRQSIFLSGGIVGALILSRFPIIFWEKIGPVLLFASIFLLVIVLIPGIGHVVNGSRRWLSVGGFGLQVSELIKLSMIIFLAGYLVRRQEEVCTQVSGFLKPIGLLGVIAILLLLEPDFGATVVVSTCVLTLLFLGGVKLRHFMLLVTLAVGAMSVIAITSPYRLQRLTSFLNPWANQFDSGYQLTQALIAFGRGGWSGVGLGESVQKLFYLPEAHTDFLFAVLAEELGLIGMLFVLIAFMVLVVRAFWLGRKMQQRGELFPAYLSFGLGTWIGFQAMINMGVNMGVLPTKGLTLPFMSYGGSSLLVNCVTMALLFRIGHEYHSQATSR